MVTKMVTKGLGLALLLGVTIALPACELGGDRLQEGAEETEADDQDDDNDQDSDQTDQDDDD